ncbi:MAG: DUF3379 domain-containing protein, partial [Pseudomonadales bacterium]|nr:DUF3379 domain-containing protein [Pseudomonadales bacterium]
MTEPLDRTMNDAHFSELLHADPLSQNPALLAAAQATPERQALWQAARADALRLRAMLNSVTPPPDLQERLLNLPDQPAQDP